MRSLRALSNVAMHQEKQVNLSDFASSASFAAGQSRRDLGVHSDGNLPRVNAGLVDSHWPREASPIPKC